MAASVKITNVKYIFYCVKKSATYIIETLKKNYINKIKITCRDKCVEKVAGNENQL